MINPQIRIFSQQSLPQKGKKKFFLEKIIIDL